MNLHLALKDLGEGGAQPSWLCWTVLASVTSQIKAFQTKPVSVSVSGVKKLASRMHFVFIYIQTPVCSAVKKNTSLYVHIQQSSTLALICACPWKNIGKLTMSHSLLLHLYCKQIHRDTREQLLASSTKHGWRISYLPKCVNNSSFILSTHHKTLLEKIQKRACLKLLQTLRKVRKLILRENKSWFDRSSRSWHLRNTTECVSLEKDSQNYRNG